MDAAAAVHRLSFDDRLPALAGLHTPEEDRGFFRGYLFAECELWGAFDGALVGFIALSNQWIEQLYVLPQWQGYGVGRALLKIAKGKSATLKLWTFQENGAAREFYEQNGFVAIEMTDGLGNEEKAPDVLYQWMQR
ncbi:MAG: GNAT family N-acetyltransferase [Hyphomicrobiales bacterium]|nr:MAG: GNAT family N-acetyltransferase [Hyphomicrobiales bacterium]